MSPGVSGLDPNGTIWTFCGLNVLKLILKSARLSLNRINLGLFKNSFSILFGHNLKEFRPNADISGCPSELFHIVQATY